MTDKRRLQVVDPSVDRFKLGVARADVRHISRGRRSRIRAEQDDRGKDQSSDKATNGGDDVLDHFLTSMTFWMSDRKAVKLPRSRVTIVTLMASAPPFLPVKVISYSSTVYLLFEDDLVFGFRVMVQVAYGMQLRLR